MNDEPPAAPEPGDTLPLGHSESAHRLLGWCSHCPGRSAAAEVVAWRSWAITLLHTVDEGVCSGA
ncbi:hypothetical protein [Nonomuraea recticatena]|uniref:Uncharacterized protein n=1 Tax=Nonomuraea recticatena TaxID=46178 RepID=A0ABP6E6M5_9ACTN